MMMVALLLASMATHLPSVRAQSVSNGPRAENPPQEGQLPLGVVEGHSLSALIYDGRQAKAYTLPSSCGGRRGRRHVLYSQGAVWRGLYEEEGVPGAGGFPKTREHPQQQ